MSKLYAAQLTKFYKGFDPSAKALPLFNIINYSNFDNQGFVGSALPDYFWSQPGDPNDPAPPHGTKGNDLIHLNAGDDLFIDTFTAVTFIFNPDTQETEQHIIQLDYGGGKDWIYGGLGADKIYAGIDEDHVYGGTNADFIQGGEGHDRLYGNDGADTLGGNEGNDFLDGGPENDILGAQYDPLGNVPPPSQLLSAPWSFGDPGNDTMMGGPGQDTIYGGTGIDDLWGGADGDTFKFNLGADGILDREIDRIHDFEPVLNTSTPELYDQIVIDFSALKAGVGDGFSTQFLNTTDYILEPGVHINFKFSDPYAGFVYDNKTHDLYYDVGQETVYTLLHLNQEIDRLYIISQTDTTITLGGMILGEP